MSRRSTPSNPRLSGLSGDVVLLAGVEGVHTRGAHCSISKKESTSITYMAYTAPSSHLPVELALRMPGRLEPASSRCQRQCSLSPAQVVCQPSLMHLTVYTLRQVSAHALTKARPTTLPLGGLSG
jgi:hypothetical protein